MQRSFSFAIRQGNRVPTIESLPMPIRDLLGERAAELLDFAYPKIPRESLTIPSGSMINDVYSQTDRSAAVLRNLGSMYNHGRLAGTGYLSILPVDQGIEHTAGAAFAPNPIYFDPTSILELAIQGGCSAVASTVGVLGAVARRYAHQIPFIVKLNHNELISYPNDHNQIMFASVQQAFQMGAVGVGATIYFGSEHTRRQIQEVSRAFEAAHQFGMFTVLWCYVRNPAFATEQVDYHDAADLTGQANHLGATIQADIVKQKLPETNFAFRDLQFGKQHPHMYERLSSPHLIDLTRYQVLNGYAGKVPLISSGGPSGANDYLEAITAAVINKRAGGAGMILGRKAFQKPFDEGVSLLRAVQDVYLDPEVTVA
jgi:class I fructose-bisphosphate aldolase